MKKLPIPAPTQSPCHQAILYDLLAKTKYRSRLLSPGTDSSSDDTKDYDIVFADLSGEHKYDSDKVTATVNKYNDACVIALVKDDETGIYALADGAIEYLVTSRYHEAFIKQVINTALYKKGEIRQKERENIDYKKYFHDSPLPKWIFDTETLAFLDVNEAAIINYGYSRDEFLSMTINDIRPQTEILGLAEVMKSAEKDVYHDARYWRHIKKDGSVFFAHIFSRPLTFKGRRAKLILAVDVDEQVKTERINKALTDSVAEEKNKHEAILSSLTEIVWSIDADSHELLYMNEAGEKILGYTKEERMADKEVILNAIHPQDREKYNAALKNIYKSGKMKCEYRYLHKDGTLKHLITTAVLKTGTNWGRNTINGITIDVSKLRDTECALREKAEEMRDILEGTPNAFFAIDKNWNFTYINEGAEKLYQVKREDVLGVNIWEFFPPVLRQTKFYSEFGRVMNEGISVVFEEQSPTLGIWISAHIFPIPNGIAGFFIDITEQKKLREQIKKDEQNLLGLINNTTDMMWSVDNDLNIITANEAYKDFILKTSGEKVKSGSNALQENTIASWEQNYRRAFEGYSHSVIDKTTVNECPTYLETSFNPIKNGQGEVVAVSISARDITGQRKYMLMIEEQNTRLREIAWIQSHKVRGPVATMLGLMQLFNYERPEDEVNKEILEGLRVSANKLDDVIKEVVYITEE